MEIIVIAHMVPQSEVDSLLSEIHKKQKRERRIKDTFCQI